MSKKITFSGEFGEYFIMSLGLMILSGITFGLAFPYWVYWSFKCFFTKMEIQEQVVSTKYSFTQYDFDYKSKSSISSKKTHIHLRFFLPHNHLKSFDG